jgi:envelope integrity protein A
MRRAVIGVVAVGSLVSLLLGLALAQAKKPDATLKLTEGTVAVGIGFSWGKGTLDYKGKNYPVKVDGLSVGEVGVNRATAVGNVRNLKQLADFDGNYVAAGAEVTVAGGAGVTAMKNQNGVVIELKSTTQGASLKLAAEGLKLSIVK